MTATRATGALFETHQAITVQLNAEQGNAYRLHLIGALLAMLDERQDPELDERAAKAIRQAVEFTATVYGAPATS